MHYLDNAATTQVLPEAAEAAVRAMCEAFGNPSSLHKMGVEASHLLEDSRKTVAAALGCLPRGDLFYLLRHGEHQHQPARRRASGSPQKGPHHHHGDRARGDHEHLQTAGRRGVRRGVPRAG